MESLKKNELVVCQTKEGSFIARVVKDVGGDFVVVRTQGSKEIVVMRTEIINTLPF